MKPDDVEKKIKEYEYFLEDTLKKDLKDIEEILKDKVSKHKDWGDIKHVTKTVRKFKEMDSDMTVRVDIGDGIMVTAEISDYENMYISVGLDYMLEMDCDEADKYSDIRMKLLTKEINHFRKLAVDVKVHIKMVLLAINELQTSLLSSNKR